MTEEEVTTAMRGEALGKDRIGEQIFETYSASIAINTAAIPRSVP
jgi:hypothetical protein